MKKAIRCRGKEMVLRCSEMSHSAVGGEYELSLSGKVELDLQKIEGVLANAGYELEDKKDRAVTLVRSDTAVTILKKGRILIQDLLPDTFDEALRIGEEVISAEAGGPGDTP